MDRGKNQLVQVCESQPVSWLQITYRTARRVLIAVTGGLVVLTGIVMFVTPGPAFVVIPIGIAILATEFEWARRMNQKLKERAAAACEYVRNKKASRNSVQESSPAFHDSRTPRQPAGSCT